MHRITSLIHQAYEYFKANSTFRWLLLPFLFFLLMMAVFPAPFLIKWLSWVLVAVSTWVVITYAESVISGLRHNGPMPRYTHLAMGIFLGWLALDFNRFWAGMIRLYPLELWMRDSYFIAFYVWTSIMAGIFHLTAPGAIDGVVPKENWIKIGLAITVGIVLGALATFMLLTSGLADSLPPDLLSNSVGKA